MKNTNQANQNSNTSQQAQKLRQGNPQERSQAASNLGQKGGNQNQQRSTNTQNQNQE